MPGTNFVDKTTPIVSAWLNPIDRAVFDAIGDGSSATSSRSTGENQFNITTAASIGTSAPATFTFHLLNYANTSTFKTALTRAAIDKNGSGVTTLDVALWRSTAAVTSLGFNTFGAANFTTSTTATLYGIRAVSS